MFLYKVIHRVIHRLFITHNLICKVIMVIKVKTLCKLALQVTIKNKIKQKKYTTLYCNVFIFKRHSPYKAFIFLLIYLYICFIKFADTIQKKSVDWCKVAIQLQVAGLSTFCDTVGNFLKFHYTGKIWKNKIIPF